MRPLLWAFPSTALVLAPLFDIDSAHVAEDQDWQLAAAIPGDRHVVLLGDGALLLHENRVRGLTVDHDGQNLADWITPCSRSPQANGDH